MSVAALVTAVTSASIGAFVSAAVVYSSFLEQDEKDNVKIIIVRKGVIIFLLYHFR